MYIDGFSSSGKFNEFLIPNILHAIFEIIGMPLTLFRKRYLRIGWVVPTLGLTVYIMVNCMNDPPLGQDGQHGMQKGLLKIATTMSVIGLSALLHAMFYDDKTSLGSNS